MHPASLRSSRVKPGPNRRLARDYSARAQPPLRCESFAPSGCRLKALQHHQVSLSCLAWKPYELCHTSLELPISCVIVLRAALGCLLIRLPDVGLVSGSLLFSPAALVPRSSQPDNYDGHLCPAQFPTGNLDPVQLRLQFQAFYHGLLHSQKLPLIPFFVACPCPLSGPVNRLWPKCPPMPMHGTLTGPQTAAPYT